jgi:hypothetical protein
VVGDDMMKYMNYFFRNVNLLNLLLLGGISFFTYYVFMPILDLKFSFMLPAVENKSLHKRERVSVPAHISSISDYILISDNNIFHPERKIPIEKQPVEQQPPLPKPEFVLYGTLINGDTRLAYLEDLRSPKNTPGRGKRQTAMRIGDSLAGFVLKEVGPDMITLVRGDEKILVAIHDAQKKKHLESAIPAMSSSAQPDSTLAKQPSRKSPLRTPASTGKIAEPPSSLPSGQIPRQDVLQPINNPVDAAIFDFIERNRKTQ